MCRPRVLRFLLPNERRHPLRADGGKERSWGGRHAPPSLLPELHPNRCSREPKRLSQASFEVALGLAVDKGGSDKSEQPEEILNVQSGLADDGSQRSPIELPVIRHNHLCERGVASEDHVAAFLPLQDEASPCQSSRAFSSRYAGQPAHTATTSVSKRSSGTGRPSSSRAATYPRMASLMFPTASSLVLP